MLIKGGNYENIFKISSWFVKIIVFSGGVLVDDGNEFCWVYGLCYIFAGVIIYE